MRRGSNRGYSSRRYLSRRNARRRNLILMSMLAVVILVAVVVGVFAYSEKVRKEQKEQQLAYRQEGIEYYEQGDYEKALKCFQKALADSKGEISDVEMDIYFYKARTQYELGDTKGALDTYHMVIKDQESPKAYFLRGNLYSSMGDKEKGLADYEKAVALLEKTAKEDRESYYYLFRVYDTMENDEKALENLNIYMEKATDLDSYRLYEIGSSLLNKAMYEDAEACFLKALELKKVPNKQEIMRNLVVIYERNKDFASAKEVMKQYIEEYPEDEEALREYTFLETR